jgi:hypothetical protein
MAKCSFCDDKAEGFCPICQSPACELHKHPVNRWHNVFHARWICERCYQAKEKKRRIVLVPLLALFAYLIAATMDITWGIKEPSFWAYLWAMASLALGVVGYTFLYHTLARTGKARKWLLRFLPVLLVWIVIFLIQRSLGT